MSSRNNNLFPCPDCLNLCSKTAPNCPSCGKVFNPTPVYIAKPPSQTSAFTWFVLAIVIAVPLICFISAINNTDSVTSAPPRTDPQDFNNPSGRTRYANGLHQMAIENGKETVFEAVDSENRTLSIKSKSITASDCAKVAFSDYGKDAALIGFDKVRCRNDNSLDSWIHSLSR